MLPSLCYAGSVLLYLVPAPFQRLSAWAIGHLAVTGAISYGLYIIHFPVVAVFARVQAFSGTPLTFALRALLYLALCVGAAYLLEKKLQPAVRRWLG